MSKEILIITCNHFDPTWRRCFDRSIVYNGQTFVSYADLEEFYMEDNLALAQENPEYRFDCESVIVLRKYLERRPERLPELRKLCETDRFGVGGAGDNVIDVNMVLGESIVRNFVYGQHWIEKTLGYMPKLAARFDGFGNSAQLPQILRGCGFTAVTGLSYSGCPNPYWRGLDKTAIRVVRLPSVRRGGSVKKYAPCGECAGVGCSCCGNRGIEDALAPLPADLEPEACKAECSAIWCKSEEMLPNPEIICWAGMQETNASIRFALLEEMLLAFKDYPLDPAADADVHIGELNPNNSGCWVTRIKTKQECRRQEYAMLSAEAAAVLAGRGNLTDEQTNALRQGWEDLLFTMFHDAITATHVDAAFEEIKDYWHRIDEATEQVRPTTQDDSSLVTVANMTGFPSTQLVTTEIDGAGKLIDAAGNDPTIVSTIDLGNGKQQLEFVACGIAPFSTVEYTVVKGASSIETAMIDVPVIENQRYRVSADDNGITEIFDKELGCALSVPGEYRPAELLLERDYGSPWATLFADRRRVGLAGITNLVGTEAVPGQQRLIFEGTTPSRMLSNQNYLKFRLTVTLTEGVERIDFNLDAHWDSHNTRVRVALPTELTGDSLYGIPYGMLAREEYEGWFEQWTGANGDWPAIDWAGVEGDGLSVALLSKGLPSYCTETSVSGVKTLFLSILRSPTDGTYLNEPQNYSMPEYMGMRDAGEHSFDFAITSYHNQFADSGVVADATTYNAGLATVNGRIEVAPPTVVSDVACISSIKAAEDSNGIVVRLWEYRGKGGGAKLHLPSWLNNVAQVNMLERDNEDVMIEDGAVEIDLSPWEIATLKLVYCNVPAQHRELPTIDAKI